MSIRSSMVYVAIGFDVEGQVRDVALRAGVFGDVASDVFRESFSQRRAYDFGGAVIAAPLLSPSEVQTAVHNALFFPLPKSFAPLLCPWEAQSWCGERIRDGNPQGGVRLTGPLGRTALTPASTEPF